MGNEEFICNFAHPYIKCGFTEFLVAGILYYILAIFCIYFLYQNFIQRKILKLVGFDFNMHFWLTMVLWCIYHGTFEIIFVNWDINTLYIFTVCLDAILFLIPSSLFVVIISETLFIYRNPGIFIMSFSRLIFGLFFTIFIVLGVVTSCVKSINEIIAGAEDIIQLWLGCFNLLMFCFILMPSLKLIQAISTPVVLPEDVKCMRMSKFGLFLLCFLYLLRSLFDILSFCGENPLSNWIITLIEQSKGGTLKIEARMTYFAFDIVFYFGCALMIVLGVTHLRKYDLYILGDPLYTQEKSETDSMLH